MIAIDVLMSLPLFSALSAEQLAMLASCATVQRVARRTVILQEGGATGGLYVLLSGRVKVCIPDSAGKEVILAVLGPHEYFGEMALIDDEPCSAGVEALDACVMVRIARSDFLRSLTGNAPLAMGIMRGLAQRLRGADRQIESLALMDVYGRVARVLIEASTHLDGRHVIEKLPPRQEIAARVGASREMVSRVIRDLQVSGHIQIAARRMIIVSDEKPRRRARGRKAAAKREQGLAVTSE